MGIQSSTQMSKDKSSNNAPNTNKANIDKANIDKAAKRAYFMKDEAYIFAIVGIFFSISLASVVSEISTTSKVSDGPGWPFSYSSGLSRQSLGSRIGMRRLKREAV